MAKFKNKQLILLITIFVMMMVVEISALEEKITTTQLHRYYDDGHYQHSGMSRFAALIIGVVCGILCFLGIMYYFKWRRESGGNMSLWDMVTGRGNSPQQQYGYQQQQNQAHYVNSPNGGYQNQGAPGYYNNPNYPNYPPL